MIQYWTFWNLNWWLLAQTNYVYTDYALLSSLVITSAIGGYMTHIYPRKLKIYVFNKTIKISYFYASLIDICFHHLPLFVLYKQRHHMIKRCGSRFLVPIACYSLLNSIRNTPLTKTYGINTIYIYGCGISIYSMLGLYFHPQYLTKN